MKFAIPTILFMSFANSVISQVQPCGSLSQEMTYNLCRERTDQFKTSTCDVMTNSTMQAKCECFYQRDLLNCFAFCLDPGPQAELASLSISAPQFCLSAGYDNFPILESPAPWQTDFTPAPSADEKDTTDTSSKPATTETAGSSLNDDNSGAGKMAVGAFLALACAVIL